MSGGSCSHELSEPCSEGIQAESWSCEKIWGWDFGEVQKMPVVGFQLLWNG